MAIISSYPYDIVVQDKDAWIGTDSVTRRTKQYTAEAIAGYLNTQGKISVGGKMVYKFVSQVHTKAGSFSLQSGSGNGTPFSDIVFLEMHYTEASGQDVVPFMEYIVNRDILISSQKALSDFGHYKVVQFTQNTDPNLSSWYTLKLEYIGGNGSLVIDDSYDIISFNLGSGSGGDKNFTFEQAVPSNVWTINHNMSKRPSVSIVVSPDLNTQAFGQVDYIDDDNLTITLGAAATGFAYLN